MTSNNKNSNLLLKNGTTPPQKNNIYRKVILEERWMGIHFKRQQMTIPLFGDFSSDYQFVPVATSFRIHF